MKICKIRWYKSISFRDCTYFENMVVYDTMRIAFPNITLTTNRNWNTDPQIQIKDELKLLFHNL